MAAENKSVANLLNLCHLLMEELRMPSRALQELVDRASATTTTELKSLQSVKYWKYVAANFYAVEEKIPMGPFKPDKNRGIIMKPQIPDLNQPAPGNYEEEQPWEFHLKPSVIIQDRAKVVEVEAEATTATCKRKKLQSQHEREIAQANHRVTKRFKSTGESAGPSNIVKGKGIFEMEGWGEN